jgi:hypothetical protein
LDLVNRSPESPYVLRIFGWDNKISDATVYPVINGKFVNALG